MTLEVKKVLFIDSTHPCLAEDLIKAGFVCDFFFSHSRNDIEKIIHQYTGIIIRSRITVDKVMLEKASKLEFIGRVGSGMENIDVMYAEQKGIVCLNSPEGNRVAVAEHALAMLLCLFNNLIKANQEVRQGIWKREENRGLEIKGKTIGLIGYGNTGSAFAERLKGFEATVIAYDKYKTNFGNDFVREATLDHLFEQADILSLHIPLTPETTYMINDAFLNCFKKNIFFINTSRGEIVNTNDLVMNLKSEKVIGAALDVLEYESTSFEELAKKELPEAFNYLVHSSRVILSPHIAGWTVESHYKLAKILGEKILTLFRP